jgi:hypothetical protein
LPLHKPEPNDRFFSADGNLFFLVIDIVPFKKGGKGLGFGVMRKIFPENFLDMEIIGYLESEDWIVYFPCFDFLEILFGSKLPGIILVTGNPASGNYRPEVEILAQFLAGIIQSPAKTHIAIFGMHENIKSIEYIAIRIMGVEPVVPGYLPVGMGIAKLRIVNYDRQCAHATTFPFTSLMQICFPSGKIV